MNDFLKEVNKEKGEIERLYNRSLDTLMSIESDFFRINLIRSEIEFLKLFLEDDIFKLYHYKNDERELYNEKIFTESKKYSYLFLNDRIYFFIKEKSLNISKRLKEGIEDFTNNVWDGFSPDFIKQSKALALASQNKQMIDAYIKEIKRYYLASE